MDDKIAAWLDYLASQRGLAPSTQREYRRDMRLLVAHLVDRDGRHFLAGIAQQHGPITDVGDITPEHLAALLMHPTPPRAWSFPNPNRPSLTSPTAASTMPWPAWPRHRCLGSTARATVDGVFGNLQFYNPPGGKG